MPRATRKERVYRRQNKAARHDAALNDALTRRVQLLHTEVDIAQRESIPVDDRPNGWQEQREAAQKQLDRQSHEIQTTMGHAESLAEKPYTPKEKKEHEENVDKARLAEAQRILDSWEDALAGHVRNLVRLKALPSDLRQETQRDQSGAITQRGTAEEIEENEQAVAVLDRAIDCLVAMFPPLDEEHA